MAWPSLARFSETVNGESEPHGVGEVPQRGHTGPTSICQSWCCVPIGPLPCARASAGLCPWLRVCIPPLLGTPCGGQVCLPGPVPTSVPGGPLWPQNSLGGLAGVGSPPLSLLTPGYQRPPCSGQASELEQTVPPAAPPLSSSTGSGLGLHPGAFLGDSGNRVLGAP